MDLIKRKWAYLKKKFIRKRRKLNIANREDDPGWPLYSVMKHHFDRFTQDRFKLSQRYKYKLDFSLIFFILKFAQFSKTPQQRKIIRIESDNDDELPQQPIIKGNFFNKSNHVFLNKIFFGFQVNFWV